MECKNCGIALEGVFCSDCGQKVMQQRITLGGLFRELFAIITNVEKGFWYTAHRLFESPGIVVQEYLSGKTVRYYHPLRYLFLWVTFAVAITLGLGLYDLQQDEFQSYLGTPEDQKVLKMQHEMREEVKKYLSLFPLILVPFMSLASYRLFKKKGWNYAEHLVLNAYTQGQVAMVGILIQLLGLVTASTMVVFWLSMIFGLGYGAFVYFQFFKVRVATAFFKTLLTHLLGYGILVILAMMGGALWAIFKY